MREQLVIIVGTGRGGERSAGLQELGTLLLVRCNDWAGPFKHLRKA
jgi:hypothetical protein